MNFNLVVLAGNLTRDPELTFVGQNNTPLTKFGLAINRVYKDKKEATFVECETWGRTAEVISEHFSKGKPIHLQGRLAFDQWQDREGQKRSKLKVVVDSFQFVGVKSDVVAKNSDPSAAAENTTPVGQDDIPF